jgi:hypothetical protein
MTALNNRQLAWTPERRAKQAEAIRGWRPWTRSTGPKTPAGKAISARNASKRDIRVLCDKKQRRRLA